MRYATLNTKQYRYRLTEQSPLKAFTIYILLLAFLGCKKSGEFYKTLDALPQIDNSPAHAYKTAYIVGDTMNVYGKFQIRNNFNVTIGGTKASILKIDSSVVNAYKDNTFFAYLYRVRLSISSAMVGRNQSVKIYSAGNSIDGNAIDVYNQGGVGSFTDSLKVAQIKTLTSTNSVFLYCLNGKGDVYYYDPSNKNIKHISKDSSEENVLDLSGSISQAANLTVRSFLAGGVDSQGKYMYLSVTTQQGYCFCKYDMTTKELTILNQSSNLTAPFEGLISQAHLVITGVFPSKDRVYLALGMGNQKSGSALLPDAIAVLDLRTNLVSYRYKRIYFNIIGSGVFPGMPGTILIPNTSNGAIITKIRINADEDILYTIEAGTTGNNIQVFDLSTGARLNGISIQPAANTDLLNVIGPFTGLKIDLGSGGQIPDFAFGFMPMSGRRLQCLLYQYVSGAIINQGSKNVASQLGFPKWTVFDFIDNRTYAYAPGRFNVGANVFQPVSHIVPSSAFIDELLNYDEDGNLLMTTNGRTSLIKTKTIN